MGVIASLPVDLSGFDRVMFFSAEPAMKWGDNGITDEQDADKDGRKLYNFHVVVQYVNRYNSMVVETVKVKAAEVRGQDPNQTCVGKELSVEGLSVNNWVKRDTEILNQSWTADSIGPAEQAGARARSAEAPAPKQ